MFYIENQKIETIGLQIRTQLITLMGKGILKSNDGLPSIESLAYSLGINPMRIKEAYEKLIQTGMIYQENNDYFLSNKADMMHIEDDILTDFNHQVQIMYDYHIPKVKLNEVVNVQYKGE